MRIQIRWIARQPASSSERRLEQFRSVLMAALRTRKYQPALQSAGLGSAETIARVSSVRRTLDVLPRIDAHEYRSGAADCRNPVAPMPGPQELRFPLALVPRTAVLTPGFVSSGPVQVLTADWERRLELFRPEAIAGPLPVLRMLAASALSGKARIPPLRNAVIAFSRVGEHTMGEADRDLFWRVFQVPVFEQLLGFDGRVIAWECEAHDGLHIDEDHAFIEEADGTTPEMLLTSLTDLRYPALRVGTELAFHFEHSACGCGRREPRLEGLRPVALVLTGATCAAD
jgi:hypothetical protein